MNNVEKLLLWSPRILGLLVAFYLGVFALDAFSEGETFLEALPGFIIHVAPALLLLLVVAVSWRWPLVGAAVFISLAVLYAVNTHQRMDWVFAISGPLLVVGALFLISWRRQKELLAQS